MPVDDSQEHFPKAHEAGFWRTDNQPPALHDASAEICTASGHLSPGWWCCPMATRKHRCHMLYGEKSNFPVTWGMVVRKSGTSEAIGQDPEITVMLWNNSAGYIYINNSG